MSNWWFLKDTWRHFVGFPFFFTNKTSGLMTNHIDALPNILTCMSRRVMKPLPSMSQIWKNSLVFSSKALQSLSLGVPCLSSLRWDARFTLEPQVLDKDAIPFMCVCLSVRMYVCANSTLLTWVSPWQKRRGEQSFWVRPHHILLECRRAPSLSNHLFN